MTKTKEKLKLAAIINIDITIMTGFMTAAFWWSLPGKWVFIALAGLWVTLCVISAAGIVAVQAARRRRMSYDTKIKTERDGRCMGYISAEAVCRAAKIGG